MICIIPLLLTAHLPLVDLPGHLARQYVIRDWSSSPDLQRFYYIHWALVPNLALEIFVLVARQVVSIDMAVRAFCISTMLLLFLGTRLVNRELGSGQTRIYRLAPLLCYGGPFQYGFLSYCFGVGLALLFFGFYLRLRSQPLARLATTLVPLGVALLLCHLAAFGLFAIAIGCCELNHGYIAAGGVTRRLPRELLKRQLRPVCCLLPVFLIFLGFSPRNGDGAADHAISFSTLHDKARSFASIMLFSSPKLEVTLLALAMAGLAAALLSRTIRLHAIAATIVAMLLIVWLLLPATAYGTALIDYRLPWAISFFLLVGLLPGLRHQRLLVPFGLYFGALTLGRIAMIATFWLSWEPTLTALDHALSGLPVGARLMVVEGRLPGGGFFRQPTLTRFASYAVARRQAFDPGIFANMSGQILFFQPHFTKLWQQDALGESRTSLDRLSPDYNYVLVLVPALAHISPRLPLVCQTSGPNFELLKVVASTAPLPGADRRGRCSG
ncbi:hypothetical protein [Rhodopila sp.]|uniref:hypothetical protein n=1 Tax=Rhodopila sp. TaxID=2480087 RepID=UPI003D0C2CFC